MAVQTKSFPFTLPISWMQYYIKITEILIELKFYVNWIIIILDGFEAWY